MQAGYFEITHLLHQPGLVAGPVEYAAFPAAVPAGRAPLPEADGRSRRAHPRQR